MQKLAVVEFFAPWCGHCQKLQPQYEEAAKVLANFVLFAKVNCDIEKPLCGKYGINGFPTIKVFKYDQASKKKKIYDYSGERTTKSIVEFLKSRVHSYVSKVSSSDLNNVNDSNPFVILFSNKTSPGILIKALSIQFKDKVKFLFVSKENNQLLEKFEVTNLPKIMFFPLKSSQGIQFNQAINYQNLFDFIETQMRIKDEL